MTEAEAMASGRELDVYLDSEMADEKTGLLDDLWQSIYDVVQLATGGIIESDPREIADAIAWLKEVQPMTKDYQELSCDFEVRS